MYVHETDTSPGCSSLPSLITQHYLVSGLLQICHQITVPSFTVLSFLSILSVIVSNLYCIDTQT